MKQFNVAIVGATGMVGQELIKILEERDFPMNSIRLYAADHLSAGNKLFVKHQETAVREIAPDSFRKIDVAFFHRDRKSAVIMHRWRCKTGRR